MVEPRHDRGDFRDKVAAPDPAAVPQDADAEASGSPLPEGTARAAARDQARVANSAVPRLDPNRAVTPERGPKGQRSLALMVVLSAIFVVLFAVAVIVSVRS
jgi:hypothetical protein